MYCGLVSVSILQLDAVIQQNASSSEGMAAAAEELAAQADQLSDMISSFHLDVSHLSARRIGRNALKKDDRLHNLRAQFEDLITVGNADMEIVEA